MTLIYEVHVLELPLETNVYGPGSFLVLLSPRRDKLQGFNNVYSPSSFFVPNFHSSEKTERIQESNTFVSILIHELHVLISNI